MSGYRLFLAAIAAVFSATLFAAPPTPPAVDGKAWFLLDMTSNQQLGAYNAHARVDPADLVQIMTAFVACGALQNGKVSADQQVPPSESAWRAAAGRATMYLEASQAVSVADLLNGMAILGARDASVSLAEAIAKDESSFAGMMYQEGQRLGLKGSNFLNASGATAPGQYTTAADMALLTAAFIRRCPDQYARYAERSFTHSKIVQQNHNRLLWLDSSVDGVAVGHDRSVGWNIVASAKRGPRRLVAVVIGAGSERGRTQSAQQLLNFGFQSFDAVRLFNARQAVRELQVWKGESRKVKVGFQEDFVIAVPRDQLASLKLQLESQQPLLAPLTAGQSVGRLKLTLDGTSYGEYPVVALEEVPLASWFRRAWDAVRLWLK